MADGGWIAVFVWVLLFTAFAALFVLPFRRRDWRSAGVFEAFLIALFTEMFGFPLTLYVLSSALGLPAPGGTEHLLSYVMGSSNVAAAVVVGGSFVLIGIGAALVVLGWRAVWGARDRLVTTGVYAWLRHPQYLGLIALTLGLLFWWPTILTIPMWPVLAAMYVRLARREERELDARFGDAYERYRQSVPGFFPRRRRASARRARRGGG